MTAWAVTPAMAQGTAPFVRWNNPVLTSRARRDSNPRPSAPEAAPAGDHWRWPSSFQALTRVARRPAPARPCSNFRCGAFFASVMRERARNTGGRCEECPCHLARDALVGARAATAPRLRSQGIVGEQGSCPTNAGVGADCEKADGVCLKRPPPARAPCPQANPGLHLAILQACGRVAPDPRRCAVTRA